MKQTLFSCANFLASVMLIAGPAFAGFETSIAHKLSKPHVKNRVLLKRRAALKSYEAGIAHHLGARGAVLLGTSEIRAIDFSPERSMAEALFLYGLDPSVEFVEPDYLVRATEAHPDDARFSKQWGFFSEGGGDINAPSMWESSTGDASVIVAVIDTGVDASHSDLAANMWQNPGEIAGNGIDDDKNGYVDDIYGINTVDGSADAMDDNGHGTHAAGTIAAVGNNGMGIAGVMHSAKVIACKFLDKEGSGTVSGAIECLEYIRGLKTRSQFPIDVVATNNSWANAAYSQSLYDAIARQADADIAFVTAADNFGLNNDLVETYPANFELPNLISVGAVSRSGRLAPFSNFGAHTVHVAAPGVDIESTALGDGYESLSGTSMAAPFVTGLLGLLSHRFVEHSMVQNKNLVIASQRPKPALLGRTIVGGTLRGADSDGFGAFSCQDRHIFQNMAPTADVISIEIGESLDLRVINIDCANPAGDFSAMINPTGAILDLRDDGLEPDLEAQDGIYSARFLPDKTGAFEIDLAQKKTLSVDVYDGSAWPSYRLSEDNRYSYVTFAGTRIDLADDDAFGLALPFGLALAEGALPLNHIYIGSNGILSLTDPAISSPFNAELPVAGVTTLLAPLWTDLDPSAAGPDEGVFYEIIGEEPHRNLIVEWRRVRHRRAHGKATFQVIFAEGKPKITFAYKDLGAQTATVGAQIHEMGANLPAARFPLGNRSAFSLTINEPPTADAGPDVEVALGDIIAIDGSKSTDPENPDELDYFWSQESGPKLVIFNPRGKGTGILANEPGYAVLSLRVTDDGGASARDLIGVRVEPRKNPVADPLDRQRSKKPKGSKKRREKSAQLKDLQPINPKNSAPSPPGIPRPKADLLASQGPHSLVVQNATDREQDLLTYAFEVHSVADFSHLLYARAGISPGDEAFATLALPDLPAGATYFWRARAFDGALSSDWSSGEFRLIDDRPLAQTAPEPLAAGCNAAGTFDPMVMPLALLALLLRLWARVRHQGTP